MEKKMISLSSIEKEHVMSLKELRYLIAGSGPYGPHCCYSDIIFGSYRCYPVVACWECGDEAAYCTNSGS